MKILIVDDEEEILQMLRRNLELEAYEVILCTSPYEALDLMKRDLFALVLTDIKMPGLSGVELLREIKRINPLANVIMMTGYSSMANVVDCLGSGAVDYFVKPFTDMDVLVKALNQARDRVQRWRSSMVLNR
ncbi:MAG: response regulator [Thermodesulfobacteriota bacterium]